MGMRARGGLDGGLVGGGQAGGAEHPGLARRGHGGRGRLRGGGMGEVDHHVGGGGERGQIRQQRHTGGSGLGGPRAADAAGEGGPGGGDFLGQQLTHAAGDAGDADAVCHVRLPGSRRATLLARTLRVQGWRHGQRRRRRRPVRQSG